MSRDKVQCSKPILTFIWIFSVNSNARWPVSPAVFAFKICDKKAKTAKNRVLIFCKIMAQIMVFVGEKSIGTRFKTRRCIQIGFWINYKISQILQFLNFSIFIQNPIWMHRQVLKRVPIDFSLTKTLTWAIILQWLTEPKFGSIKIWAFQIYKSIWYFWSNNRSR